MSPKPINRRLRRFLLIKEIVMLALVALNITFLVLEHLEVLSHAQLVAVELFDILTALIFIAEFIFEWYWAKDRAKYARHHWFYLLAAVPIPTTLFEEMRVIRVLRLLKIFKVFAEMRYDRNTRLFEQQRFRR